MIGSEGGAQPMPNPSGRSAVVFNGDPDVGVGLADFVPLSVVNARYDPSSVVTI